MLSRIERCGGWNVHSASIASACRSASIAACRSTSAITQARETRPIAVGVHRSSSVAGIEQVSR
jgi:hypothetical protein